MKTIMGLIAAYTLPAKITGRAYLLERCKRHNLAMPLDIVDEIVAQCEADAKKKADVAKMWNDHDLSNWRVNFEEELHLVLGSIRGGKAVMTDQITGKVLGYPQSVYDLLASRGLVAPVVQN